MAKKVIPNYDNTLVGRYIRQIENPDSIGWNSQKRIWEEPALPGYDKRNRGMGIDVLNNEDAKALTDGRPGRYLTELEERQLRNKHINYLYGAIARHDTIPNITNMSPRKEAEVMGALYRGDAKKLWKDTTSIGKALRSPNEEDFHQGINDYYRSVGLSERARNNDLFWEQQRLQQEKEQKQQEQQQQGKIKQQNIQEKIRQSAINLTNNVLKKVIPTFNHSQGGYLNSAWDSLSMREKAEMMRVAVQNGITNLKDIRQKYNEFAEGGGYTVGKLVDAVYANSPREEYLGEPAHHYDFTQSDEWADAHGYYPDARGHRDDRVKKPTHPSHPSRGTWNGDKFELTDLGMQNPNYTLFGLNDGGQDPQAVLTYQGGIVLPEITVTPKENYIFNPYDNIILYQKSEGGKIYIKPENRGKFTRLKERTGHSATWFKEHGTPAQRKMATFALNSRHWKHELGGNLFDGETEPTQQMDNGALHYNDSMWRPLTLNQMIERGRQEQEEAIRTARESLAQTKTIADKRAKDYITTSNDAIYNKSVSRNSHLVDRGIQGAMAHAAWEKEHPNLTAWGNVLGAAPFAVASIPLVGATVESIPTVASTLAPGSAFWMNPLTKQIMAGTAAAEGVNLGTKALTGRDSFGQLVGDAVEETTGWNPNSTWLGQFGTESLNPGWWLNPVRVINTAGRVVNPLTDAQKARLFETAMRSGSGNSPIDDVARGVVTMLANKDGGYRRLYNIGKYVTTGKTSNKPKGFYNSFARLYDDYYGIPGYYGGFDNPITGDMVGKNDIIDAFLFGKDIDPAFGLKKVNVGKNFGPHTTYITENYLDKANRIPVYETTDPYYTPTIGYTPNNIDVSGSEYVKLFAQNNGWTPDAAGHLKQVADNETMIMGQDIWKFNPKDYAKKWEITNPILKYGLRELDRIGTPVITRTPWFNVDKNNLHGVLKMTLEDSASRTR